MVSLKEGIELLIICIILGLAAQDYDDFIRNKNLRDDPNWMRLG